MSHRGDFALGSTVDLKFTTRQFSTGAPFTLAGSPVISAYPDNSTTQLTAGITLTVDFDSVTGLNHVRIVASGGNGYASGSTYDLVITTGTVNGVSVVGEVIGSFSLELSSALRPTTAGRTLDVSATGEAGLDFDNIKDATGSHTLTNVTVPTVTTVGTLTTYTGNTPQTGDVYPKVDTEVATLLTAAVAIQAKTDNLPSDPADASDVAAALASLASTLATIASYIDTEVAAIKAKTDSLTFTAAGVVDANVQRINDVTITGDGNATPFGV